MFPFRRFKDPVSGLTHLLTALAGIAGTVHLYVQTESNDKARLSAIIYGVSLVALFLASSVYHLLRVSKKTEFYLRKIDHSAIYVYIAGTYTPVATMLLTGRTQTTILYAIWLLAVVGISLKFIFFHAPRWLSVSVYLAMGWLCILVIQPLSEALPLEGFIWLLTGGLLYTAGALIYATKKFDFYPNVFGFHEVWHLFVSAASVAHFILISRYVLMVR